MKAAARNRGPGLGAWIALTLTGAFLAGALLETGEDRPRVGRVRLDELATEFLMHSVRDEASPDVAAERARDWAHALQEALDRVALQHGVVLLPSNAVVAGAADYTEQIRTLMPSRETPAAGSSPAPGSSPAAAGAAVVGERSLHQGFDASGETP